VIYAPLVNPTANIPPSPNLLDGGSCTGGAGNWTCTNPCVGPDLTWAVGGNTPACSAYSMLAINNARSSLGENPLTLPSNWNTLTYPEQLFVIANMERVSAGYPPYLGLNDALNSEAQVAANSGGDPSPAAGFVSGLNPWGSTGFDGVWAGTDNVLFAEYMWMYDDGWGGSAATTSNILCTAPGVWACWDHRDNLLGSSTSPTQGVGLGCTTCEMGAAFAVVNGASSLVDLIELPADAPPAMSFTWASEVSFFPSEANPSSTPAVSTTGLVTASEGTVNSRKISFGAGGLKIAWSLSFGGATTAAVTSFAGQNCKYSAKTHRVMVNGVSSGVLSVPFRGNYVAKRYYSAHVMIVTQLGAIYARCINLGRA
jgi:hypothetical protein